MLSTAEIAQIEQGPAWSRKHVRNATQLGLETLWLSGACGKVRNPKVASAPRGCRVRDDGSERARMRRGGTKLVGLSY